MTLLGKSMKFAPDHDANGKRSLLLLVEQLFLNSEKQFFNYHSFLGIFHHN